MGNIGKVALGIAFLLGMLDSSSAAQWSGFEQGMGIGGWLTNYKRFNVLPMDKRLGLTEGDYIHFDTYITEGDVERIKRWGFDHVRLGFDQIVLEESPYKYRERTFRKIDDFIGWCRKHDMHVVLNLHKAIGNYCDIPEKVQLLDDDELQRRFLALWLEIERRYHDFPDLAFEILNEVRDVDPVKWNRLADRTIKAIREKNPTRWIVVGSTAWNSVDRLKDLQLWDDERVVYTFHMYDPHLFTHQRGVLQAGPLYQNEDVAYPGREAIEKRLQNAADWMKNHPGKILWNGEFGTIRHMIPTSRVAYMRDIVRFCRQKEIPYCVWNYLSTPNDGNRFSLVDDDTRDFLSDELQRACLGIGDKDDGELKYMTFNIWGPYFGNPVSERDLKIVDVVIKYEPDLVGFQECVKAFWESRLFTRLKAAGYEAIKDGTDPIRDLNPLIYRKDRLELLESGVEIFAKEDNPEGAKGFTWGVFKNKATGKKLCAYSTHFWWQTGNTDAEFAKNEEMRVHNVRELLKKSEEVSRRHGELAIVGGGDLNSSLTKCKASLAEFVRLGLMDAQYSVKDASQWSTHHGDPKRDQLGNLRGFFRPGSDNPSNSLDHIHYRMVTPKSLIIDRSENAMESSDHSPVIFSFVQ